MDRQTHPSQSSSSSYHHHHHHHHPNQHQNHHHQHQQPRHNQYLNNNMNNNHHYPYHHSNTHYQPRQTHHQPVQQQQQQQQQQRYFNGSSTRWAPNGHHPSSHQYNHQYQRSIYNDSYPNRHIRNQRSPSLERISHHVLMDDAQPPMPPPPPPPPPPAPPAPPLLPPFIPDQHEITEELSIEAEPIIHHELPPPHPPSIIKKYRVYFTLTEVEEMVRLQSGKFPPTRVDQIRQQGCVLMDKVGSRLGFPRRTIGRAQLLYHRFHLFFSFSAFNVYDVAMACVWLGSKLEDTLKKLREIQLVGWVVKNVQEGGNGLGDPDPMGLEVERNKLAGIERLLLETVCFDFGSGKPAGARDVFGYVVGIGRRIALNRNFIQFAFRLAIDSHRTLVGLTFPPHVIALACLYLTSFLNTQTEGRTIDFESSDWLSVYEADLSDIEEICHQILDLLISLAGSIKSNPSPRSPTETKRTSTKALTNTHLNLNCLPNSSDLTKIKIKLRQTESLRGEIKDEMGNHLLSKEKTLAGSSEIHLKPINVDDHLNGKEFYGRDDISVRFMFSRD